MFNLEGKVVLVTGGTGGIGFSLVDRFTSVGSKVFTTSTSSKKLDLLLEKFDKSKVDGCVLDLNDFESVEELPSKVSEKFGSLDVLICNAGITKDTLAIRMKNKDWQDVIDVNLTSSFILNRESAKIMMKQHSGRIINISSIIGIVGNAGQCNYAASKAGIIAMSKSLAQEVASRGVTVNCIAPGFIETNMTDALDEDTKNKYKAKIPLGCFGKPEDVANVALFLASNSASYITGETINVNGGMLMD